MYWKLNNSKVFDILCTCRVYFLYFSTWYCLLNGNCCSFSAHHTLLPGIHHGMRRVLSEAGTLITTLCYLTCTVITEVGSLLTTHCYLTCTMVHGTMVHGTWHGTWQALCRLSAYHTLLSNMYHGNRGRLSAHHTLLPNMYRDNRGRHITHMKSHFLASLLSFILYYL